MNDKINEKRMFTRLELGLMGAIAVGATAAAIGAPKVYKYIQSGKALNLAGNLIKNGVVDEVPINFIKDSEVALKFVLRLAE